MNTYEITGYKWDMEKRWYDWDDEHKFAHFETRDQKKFVVKAKSLDHAHLWMILRHPLYAVGCGISCVENTDFLCDAVYDYYYGLGFRSIMAVNLANIKLIIKRMFGIVKISE